MRTLPLVHLALPLLALVLASCTGESRSDVTHVHTPTPSQQEEAAQLRKDLPKLDEVTEAVASAKNSGKKLTPAQIDALLKKFEQAEQHLQSIEGRLVELEGGDEHDHSDHDH